MTPSFTARIEKLHADAVEKGLNLKGLSFFCCLSNNQNLDMVGGIIHYCNFYTPKFI